MAYIYACSDGFGRMDNAMKMRPIPPAPVIRFAPCRLRLCLQGKGGAHGFLEGLYPGLF